MNDMIDKSIMDAFTDLGRRYYQMLKVDQFIPTRGSIGFTERNMTYTFCSSYQAKNSNANVWQELPIDDHQHLDSIIMEKHDSENVVDIYYIEAKRIYNKNYVFKTDASHGSLLKDYLRLAAFVKKQSNSKCYLTDKIESLGKYVEGCEIRQHIILLASLEVMSNNKPETHYDRVSEIQEFAREPIYKGKEKGVLKLECYNVKDNCQEHVNENECSGSLCEITGGGVLKNLYLYLMVENF